MGRKMRIEKEAPARPARVVQQHGSLTFDSYLCCDHDWQPTANLTEVANPEYDLFCTVCGAGGTRDEKRKQMVAYDRDWCFGNPPKQFEQSREKTRAA